LQGFEIAQFVFRFSLARGLLGVQAEAAQFGQHGQEQAQGVFGRSQAVGQHQGGIEGCHVAMDDRSADPLTGQLCIASLEGRCF